ncbi:MAG: M20 family peptidase [Pseudomonadales bacterium]|nr:M20 family peptidase [Pseudomonadales bacterium]
MSFRTSARRLSLVALALFVILAAAILVNTLRFTSKQPDFSAIEPISVDAAAAAQRLSSAVQLKTISHQNPEDATDQPFIELIELISSHYPQVALHLERTLINQKSLLFKWPGSNAALKPITFLAHHDVVPPEAISIGQWTYPPFSGAIEEGFIWGRGALDDKASVFGVLEAVEHLIASGFKPARTVYLAFGHDEEIGGDQGAAFIAQYMAKHNISSLFTLDEGMVVLDSRLSPAKKPTAIIGIAEKGYLTLKITAKVTGGHTSMPTPISSTGTLAKAITALEENQRPSGITGAAEHMFNFLGPEMSLVEKTLLANRWLFDGVITFILEQQHSTAAMIRTTTAVSMIHAGVKENVLPSQATAMVNFRIIPGETSEDVIRHANAVIANSAVTVERSMLSIDNEPSAISAADTAAFLAIGVTARQLFPGSIFAPGLVLGGTDSVHYQAVADNNYRFAPYVMAPEDLSRIHGVNERIKIADYQRMIQFYAQLILNMDSINAN